MLSLNTVKTERVPPLQPKIWRKIQTIGRVQTLETSAFRMFSCLFKPPDRGTLSLLGSLQQALAFLFDANFLPKVSLIELVGLAGIY